MTRIDILNEHFAEVYYVQDYKTISILWKGNIITPEQYRHTFNSAIEFIKQGHELVNYFSDTREQGIISPKERSWFQNHALAEAQKLGLKRGAVVISTNVLKRYYMNMVIAVSGIYKVNIKVFKDKDSAQKWLLSFGDYK